MAAVLAQKVEILQRRQPLVIVDQQSVGRAVAELEELLEDADDALDVLTDLLLGEHLPRGILARGITNFGGAASDQNDRLVPAALEVAEQHNLQQAAHMQA